VETQNRSGRGESKRICIFLKKVTCISLHNSLVLMFPYSRYKSIVTKLISQQISHWSVSDIFPWERGLRLLGRRKFKSCTSELWFSWLRLQGEDGGSVVLRNVGVLPHHYTGSHNPKYCDLNPSSNLVKGTRHRNEVCDRSCRS
jgi:hypothetical protein